MQEMLFQRTDVLIIGGGGAGIRAAIEAASLGCRVVVVDKGPIGRSGTTPMAMEAFQAVGYPGDSEEIHFRDTVEGGYRLGDENLIFALVKDASLRAKDLESFGVRFKKKPDGAHDPMHHPGQTFPRALYIQGGGFGMLAGLIREAQKHSQIRMLSDAFMIQITLDREGAASGAVFLDLKDGLLKTIQSKAVILATGGHEELWSFNDAACTACGDGIYLAHEAGAELVDLEMLQFYPTVVLHPPSIRGTLFQYELITDPEMLGGRLVNGEKDPFCEGKLLRDAVVRAIWKEIREGRGTPHGGVYIDLVHSTKSREDLTRALEKWQPNQFRYLRDMGWDLRETLVEVAPHAHYTLGGVAIDEEARTTIPGLFAAGEVAGNLHGANRVSGNALAETQVFGALAGASAASWAKGRGFEEARLGREETEGIQHRLDQWARKKAGGIRPPEIRRKLRRIMWEHCGVERDARGLEAGMKELERLKNDVLPRMTIEEKTPDGSFGAYPRELLDALELGMMMELGKLVLASALFRKESRGHHLRSDYPSTFADPMHTMVEKGKGPWAREINRSRPRN